MSEGNHAGRIELARLTKRYGGEAVVREVGLVIEPGEFFSLLGPSGSGKTTTLMMIAGFVEPDEGSVRVAGGDITHVAPQHRGLGMVFQSYALFPHLDVFENVAFPLRVRRMAEAEIGTRVREALAIVRLEAFERRQIRQLSGGQQQRVALARAIVYRPKVILMDEPLGALDKNLRYDMQVEIKDIQRRLGMTVVYVTHDQEEAMNMSDRIAIMNHGRIVQLGRPREVYESPVDAFAGRFLGEANLIAGIASGTALKLTDGRTLKAAAPLPVAGPAWLFVRPERIRIAASTDSKAFESAHDFSPPPGGEGAGRRASGEMGEGEVRLASSERGLKGRSDHSTLAGTVTRVSFLGGIIRYAVDAGTGEPLTVDVANAGAEAVAEGAKVSVAFATADARLLARDEAR